MKNIRRILIFVLLISFVGCKPQLKKETNHNDFNFLVLSDIHVKNNDNHLNRLKEFIKKVNLDTDEKSNIDFIATTGDNVSYVHSSRHLNRDSLANNQLRKYANAMASLKIPSYSCMGNHEYKIDENRDSDGFFPENELLDMEKIWEKETGLKPYYSIEKEGFKLVFLNSMRGRYQDRFFGSEQIEWFKKEVLESENLILFFHHPMRTDNIQFWNKKQEGTMTKETEPDFYELVLKNKNKIKAVFVGHGHKWINDKLFNLIDVYETASFGDNEDFMYYKVKVNNKKVNVTKSFKMPFYEGFKF